MIQNKRKLEWKRRNEGIRDMMRYKMNLIMLIKRMLL